MLRACTTLFAAALLLSTTAVTAEENCNICGADNFIGFPQGVVEFVGEDGQYRKNNCDTWQQIVNNNEFAVSPEWCQTEMLQYTAGPCRCFTPNNEMVVDLLLAEAEAAQNDENGGSTSDGSDGTTSDGSDSTTTDGTSTATDGTTTTSDAATTDGDGNDSTNPDALNDNSGAASPTRLFLVSSVLLVMGVALMV